MRSMGLAVRPVGRNCDPEEFERRCREGRRNAQEAEKYISSALHRAADPGGAWRRMVGAMIEPPLSRSIAKCLREMGAPELGKAISATMALKRVLLACWPTAKRLTILPAGSRRGRATS